MERDINIDLTNELDSYVCSFICFDVHTEILSQNQELHYSTTKLEKIHQFEFNFIITNTMINTLDVTFDNIDSCKNSSNTIATVTDPFSNDINSRSYATTIMNNYDQCSCRQY